MKRALFFTLCCCLLSGHPALAGKKAKTLEHAYQLGQEFAYHSLELQKLDQLDSQSHRGLSIIPLTNEYQTYLARIAQDLKTLFLNENLQLEMKWLAEPRNPDYYQSPDFSQAHDNASAVGVYIGMPIGVIAAGWLTLIYSHEPAGIIVTGPIGGWIGYQAGRLSGLIAQGTGITLRYIGKWTYNALLDKNGHGPLHRRKARKLQQRAENILTAFIDGAKSQGLQLTGLNLKNNTALKSCELLLLENK